MSLLSVKKNIYIENNNKRRVDMKKDMKIDVVIPAAGSGQRFGACQPKQVFFYFTIISLWCAMSLKCKSDLLWNYENHWIFFFYL